MNKENKEVPGLDIEELSTHRDVRKQQFSDHDQENLVNQLKGFPDTRKKHVFTQELQ